MFHKLKDAFREAVDNFREELNRDALGSGSGAVDRSLAGMRKEVSAAEAYLERLETEIRETTAEADREAAEIATCRRREAMARKIQDEETARIAAEYAARHERREQILRRKVAALQEELVIRREEAQEMRSTLEQAHGLRNAAGAGDSPRTFSEGELEAELGRMRDRINRNSAHREVDDLLRDFDPPHRREPPPDVDARLEELKRKMGEGNGD
jgi:chromosome segregation ATPase